MLGCRDVAQDKQIGYFWHKCVLYSCRQSRHFQKIQKSLEILQCYTSVPKIITMFGCRVGTQYKQILGQFFSFLPSLGHLKIKFLKYRKIT